MWNPDLYKQQHSYVCDYGQELIKHLAPQKHEYILDLGCGCGQLTNQIDKLVNKTIGIDLSPQMIKEAKKQFPNISFQIADAIDYHFESPFDAIFSNATLHWVLQYKKAIQTMIKNLKIGGRIVLEFGGKGNIEFIIKALRKSLIKRHYINQANLKLWYFPSISQYTTELEKAGFKVLFAQHFNRLTELDSSKNGIINWLSMFGIPFFKNVKDKDIEEIKAEVQTNLKFCAFKNGKWYADYKRLRIVAIK